MIFLFFASFFFRVRPSDQSEYFWVKKDEDDDKTSNSKSSSPGSVGEIDPIGLLKMFVETSKNSMGETCVQGVFSHFTQFS